ncbi:MAG TPA: sigma-70 factor domain-containing protein, partial [Ktedonobacteraceae bacterium]|nr:sigma-70 factor domain-containing protein [Ktedonobacteraceae bacterium]
MIDLERAMTETTLGLQNSHKDTDQEKAFEIPDAPFSADREYISEDELEDPGTDELEVEEDLGSLESGPLELEEMSDMHEDLTQVSSELEAVAILNLPPIIARHESPVRRPPMRRRRSEDDEHAANTADAGESDAVMTYLREIGRVPMITHEREVELAKRIEQGDRDAMKQFV